MENKINVTASLDNLLGLDEFDRLKEGLYILKLLNGIMENIVMYITLCFVSTV